MMHNVEGTDKDGIDFVITWVDGNDIEWQKEKLKCKKKYHQSAKIDDSVHRYRDWENLQYLFRGIEKYTPWVRKVHFVTNGQIPKWLNLNYEKVNFVRHKDFIPRQYLPTFNSNAIELNLHRIEGLSDKFVYFNDDMLITKKMKPTDFFKNGLPCDQAYLGNITSLDYSESFPHILINDIAVINKHFNKNKVILKDLRKWFALKYGFKNLFRNFMYQTYPYFCGMYWQHMPSPFLKSTFIDLWNCEEELLGQTSSHKFRSSQDVNQYLIKGWQMATSNFIPKNISKISRAFDRPYLYKMELCRSIANQEYSMICIFDTDDIEDFEELKNSVLDNLDKILGTKSLFEK